jgi:hypothetical protein
MFVVYLSSTFGNACRHSPRRLRLTSPVNASVIRLAVGRPFDNPAVFARII